MITYLYFYPFPVPPPPLGEGASSPPGQGPTRSFHKCPAPLPTPPPRAVSSPPPLFGIPRGGGRGGRPGDGRGGVGLPIRPRGPGRESFGGQAARPGPSGTVPGLVFGHSRRGYFFWGGSQKHRFVCVCLTREIRGGSSRASPLTDTVGPPRPVANKSVTTNIPRWLTNMAWLLHPPPDFQW